MSINNMKILTLQFNKFLLKKSKALNLLKFKFSFDLNNQIKVDIIFIFLLFLFNIKDLYGIIIFLF